MRKTIVALAIAAACVPAAAQFDIGRMINKTIETTKKFQEANKEFSQDDEIELGRGVTAGVLGAVKLHPDNLVELMYLGGTIALVGLALWLTHASEGRGAEKSMSPRPVEEQGSGEH